MPIRIYQYVDIRFKPIRKNLSKNQIWIAHHFVRINNFRIIIHYINQMQKNDIIKLSKIFNFIF